MDEFVLDLPITTNGLAGVQTGDTEVDVLEYLGVPIKRQQLADHSGTILDYKSVLVRVAHEKVDLVMALAGYRGVGPLGIHVGMSYEALRTSAIDVCFDQSALTWRVGDIKEIGIEIGEPSLAADELGEGWFEVLEEVTDPLRSFIASISVSA
jgi:hypothetical protein